MPKQISMVASDETVELIEKLKKELNLKSSADVIRRALILTKVAADRATGDEKIIALAGENAPEADKVLVVLK